MKVYAAIAKLLIITTVLCAESCREEYYLPIKGPAKNSSFSYATGFDAVGSKVLFAVELSQSGRYLIEVKYTTTTDQAATASLYINDIKIGEQLALPKTSDESDWKVIERNITLQKGLNYISIQCEEGDNGLFNLDYIQIKNTQ